MSCFEKALLCILVAKLVLIPLIALFGVCLIDEGARVQNDKEQKRRVSEPGYGLVPELE